MLLLWSTIIRSGKCIEAEPRAKQPVILSHTISDFHYPNSERKPFCNAVTGQCYGNKNFTKSKMSCNSRKALSIAEANKPCHNRIIQIPRSFIFTFIRCRCERKQSWQKTRQQQAEIICLKLKIFCHLHENTNLFR